MFAERRNALAFWLGSAVVAIGVLLHLPMFWMARNMGFMLAGMPMDAGMLWGMALIVAGIGLATHGLLPEGAINVLYSGRVEREKGIELLAEAFLAARAQEPALQLVVAGGGAGEDYLRERLGDTATFLGWLRGDELACMEQALKLTGIGPPA